VNATDNTIARFWRRIQLTVGRGRITAVDDSQTVQQLQIQMGALETRDKTPRMVEYGLASSPPVSAEVVVVFIAGDRSTGIAIASNHQPSRPKNLQAGEVMLYDVEGKQIYLTKDGGIVIDAVNTPVAINNATTVTVNASQEVVLNTPLLQVNGSIKATGDITDAKRSMAADRALYDDHGHSPNASSPPNPQQ
jgi:phage baseplate assembly protein V